ncbi:MAG: ATP-binding cassette domain-containing protein [Clostridia bacterium]|nr:ATP-binding cassette domain-containing protein [Clostridia bacterium]
MLELKDLKFDVDDGERKLGIIDGVNISFPEGKFIVITGPNGGGKSTLARLIMGIEKPTAGAILLDGEDISGKSVTERARAGLGYAFQQPPRFKGMTVRRLMNIASGKELSKDECCGFLSRVGLCSAEYINREVDQSLSGGEVKRIEIATLMARNPSIAIFDEPEAGIDLWSFSMLVETFKKMQKDSKGTVIIISHQERIMALADYVVVIADGKIAKQGTREEVLPTLMKEFSPSCCAMRGGEA